MYRIYLNEVKLIVAEELPKGLLNYQLLEEKGFSLADFFQEKCSGSLPQTYMLVVANATTFFKKAKQHFKV